MDITVSVSLIYRYHASDQFEIYRRLLDLGVNSTLRDINGNSAIGCLLHGVEGILEDTELRSAVAEALEKYRPLNSEEQLLNERQIIDELIDVEAKWIASSARRI